MKTDKPRTMRRLLGYVGRHKAALAGVFVFALIGNTSLLLAPKLIGRAIDLILPGTGGGYLAALLKTLAVIGVLYLAGSLFNWLTALCANLVANRTVRALRVDLFGKLGRLPLQYYDTHSHGDMMSRFTNDIDAISDGLNQGIVQLVSGVMTVLLSLAFMLSLNPMVTLVAVFVTPLCFLVGFAITKYGSRRFKEQSRTLGRLNGYAEELISGQRTVKAFGYEDRAVDGFDAINAELAQYSPELATRPQIVVANKTDIMEDEALLEKLRAHVEEAGYPLFALSAASHTGTRELVLKIAEKLSTLPPVTVYEPEYVPRPPKLDTSAPLNITVDDNTYIVEGPWLERLMANVNFSDYESRMYFDKMLRESGLFARLEEMGIQDGDIVSLYNLEFEYQH